MLRTPKELQRQGPDHLIVFLACPFDPPDQPGKAEDLLAFVQSVCDEIGRAVGARIECVRADKLSSPGVIHSDIWKHLELADALVFDVTGGNGNVLMELGVAAACRSQDNVVILRDSEDVTKTRFLFDIAPSRHILYTRTLSGSLECRSRFTEALIHALTPAPYKPESTRETRFPLRLDLGTDGDSVDLLSPPMMHRRMVQDGLEFGSRWFFKHSWMTVGDRDHRVVRVMASLRFSERVPSAGPGDGWIGIALRSEHFFANYSHLVYVRPNDSVWYTQPRSETQYEDVQVGTLPHRDLQGFIPFDLEMDERMFALRVGELRHRVDLTDATQAPYVRTAGRIRLQTHRTLAVLRAIHVEVEG